MDENLKRYRVLYTGTAILFLIILFFSFRLQILSGTKYHRLSEENYIKKKFVSAPRGRILDRRGIELANTRPGFFVSITPAIIDSLSRTEIARLLGLTPEYILSRARSEKNPYQSVKIAHDITFEQFSKIHERLEDLIGVDVGVEPLRNYPHGEKLCHLIGYVGEITAVELKKYSEYLPGNYLGRMGLEEQYEKKLRGTDGIEYIEVNVQGREVGSVMEKRPMPALPGEDLATTIDFALTESTALYLEQYQKAAVAALCPRTGEILVLYSKPGFNPNQFVRGVSHEQWQTLNDPERAPLYNRVIMSCYPPGSTFKPFVALAALNAGLIEDNRFFDPCPGFYILGNRVFRCWTKHGSLSLIPAIINSCDVYFYQLGRLIGLDPISACGEKIGFGRLTGIDLPQEQCGLMPDRKWMADHYGPDWTEGHLLNISIGQGDILITPLQLACAYTVFANQGHIPRPHLLADTAPTFTVTGIKPEAIAAVIRGLVGVVASGTGVLARVGAVESAGKTGTAQNPHGEDHSLFVGYAPAVNPEILVCVVVENAGHGGSVAAPIAGRIMAAYLNSLTPSRSTEPAATNASN